MWMSAPVRMESPLCRCDRPAATVHAARCPNPQRRGARRAARKPMRRARRACGAVRGVYPILVLVNRLQKEHLA